MKTKHYILFCALLFVQNFTAQEISLLKDINSGTNDSNATNFKLLNGNLYFTANNKTFVSGGTEQNTRELSSNLRFSHPNNGVSLNGKFYFYAEFHDADEGSKGKELCVLNNGNIALVQDIKANNGNSEVDNLIAHNGKVYFSADNGSVGQELWVYDTGTNTTRLLKNIRVEAPNTSGAGSSISNMTIHNGLIYFTAQENVSQNELWRTNGTENGTVKIAVIDTANENDQDDDIIASKINNLIDFNGKLYFSAFADGIGNELWSYDGVNNTSKLIKDIDLGSAAGSPKNFIKFNNELLFTASSDTNRGDELYKTDGTEEGTVKIKRLNPIGSASVYMNTAFEFDNKLFFNVRISSSAFLFSTDGTTENTYEIVGLADSTNTHIDNLKAVAYNDKIYFRGKNSESEIKIWETNGKPNEDSENETRELVLDEFTGNYQPKNFIVFNDKLLFTAEHTTYGNEVFSLFVPERTFVPDDAFEQFLIDEGLDTGEKDDYVNTDNIKNLTSLDISGLGIADATGLQDFVALQTLDVSNNLLETFEPNNNTNLQNLNISNNQLTSLDTRNYTNLETLNCSTNLLTDLYVLDNTTLLNLNANNNQLTTLETSGNFDLQRLEVNNNRLENLVLLGNYSLIYTDCSYNKLTNLEVFSSFNLTDIICNNNKLKRLELNNLSALKNIIVNNNNLFIFTAATSNIENIETFNATNNENLCCIQVDDVAYAETNFTNIDAQTTFSIDCNFNEATYVPDDNFEQVLIDLGYDDFLDDYVTTVYLKNVEELLIPSNNNIEENKIQDLTGIEGFENLKKLIFINHKITNLDLSKNLKLEEITAQFNEIETVALPETENLTKVDFWGNKLTTINLSQLPNLTELFLYDNNLSNLNITQNSNLEKLIISLNPINSIDLTNNIDLKLLDITLAGLTELDVTQNINLETLDCTNNALTILDVTNNTLLKNLKCNSNNTIASLDVSNNRLLESLNCMQNDIAVLDISNNIRLTEFDARINDLTCIKVWNVDFANENWSDKIDNRASFGDSCYTKIVDEKFEQALIDGGFDNNKDGFILTNIANTIETLQLSSLEIEDLSGIEAFTSLRTLNLDENKLTSVDLRNNTQLNSLIISNNLLDRLDISNNTSLTSFNAINNSDLTCIQVSDLDYATTNWSKAIDSGASFSIDCDEVWTVEVDEKAETIIITIPGIDKNNDGKITLKEAKEFVGDLDLSDKNIDDIKGLQAFSSIKSLNLSGNNIKDLSALTGGKITLISKTTGKKREVAAKASGLETLIISNNSFETLNLEELKNLKIIDVSNNSNLVTMSIKNGNNSSITSFDATNSLNLSCIIVDDKNAGYLTNFNKDVKSNFVADLADCRSKVLSTEEFLLKDVNIFPNPVTNFLTIESTKEFNYVKVYNAIGKEIIKTKKSKIDFTNLTSGTYFIKIIADNKALTKRIIKN